MKRFVLGGLLALVSTLACGPVPTTPGTGGTGGGGTGGSGNPFCAVKRILDAKCTSCHSNPPNGAPMALTSYASTQATLGGSPVYRLMGQYVSNGAMPPAPYPPLTDADKNTIVAWANAGGQGSECTTGGSQGTCETDPSYCIGEQYLPCKPDIHLTAHPRGNLSAKYTVPGNARDIYNCFQFPNPFAGGKYGVGSAPIIDNTSVIHHYLVFGANAGQLAGEVDDSGGCVGPELSDTLVSGWAPGGTNSVPPADVAMQLGQYAYLVLQIHYNNLSPFPQPDGSGVALCSTSTVRPNIAGVVTLGQDVGISAPAGGVNVPGGNGTCTNMFAFGSGTATIIASSPHMHRLGSGFTTEHIRNGQRIGYVDNIPLGTWKFDGQTLYPHNELGTGRIQVLPGDVLKTTCYYTNTTGASVGFGTRTSDEMCYDFLGVYPYSQLRRGCGSLFVSFNQ